MGVVCFQRIEKAKLPSISNGQVLSASDVRVTSQQRDDRLYFSRSQAQVKAYPLSSLLYQLLLLTGLLCKQNLKYSLG